MDKNTLSNYGWIVIAVLVLSVMIALATPFGNYVKDATVNTLDGLIGVSDNALGVISLSRNDNTGSNEKDDVFPISWNSMNVIGNTSFTLGEMPFVRISDKLPTLQEIEKSVFQVTMDGETTITPYEDVQKFGDNLFVMYNGTIFCIANTTGEITELGITISETGFYALDFGSVGLDADFQIYICNHTNTVIQNAKGATCVKDGYTGDTVCECGTIVAKGNDIPATQNHTWNEYNVCSVCYSVKLTDGERTSLSEITWNGLNSFDGQDVWTDGTNIYYSYFDKQYVLQGNTWKRKIWNGCTDIVGRDVWTDGTNIYYSNGDKPNTNHYQYVLNGDTWEQKTWNGLTMFCGRDVWTDGTNIYYSNAYNQRVLNGDTWESKTWNVDFLYGEKIWTDGTNIYFRDYCVLNGDTWESKTWNVSLGFPENIWTDGINYYYSSNTTQYVLNGDTWESKTWNGSNNFHGQNVWTDGTNYYYSSQENQYVFSR